MDHNKKNSDNLVKQIGDLFLHGQNLAEAAVILNTPLIDNIVKTDSQNIKLIEQTLDNLLDLAFDECILILFKKLCRHYYAIDPHSAAEYVLAYRDMWDEEHV